MTATNTATTGSVAVFRTPLRRKAGTKLPYLLLLPALAFLGTSATELLLLVLVFVVAVGLILVWLQGKRLASQVHGLERLGALDRLVELAERNVRSLAPEEAGQFHPIKGAVSLIDTDEAHAQIAQTDVVIGCLPQVGDPGDKRLAAFREAQSVELSEGADVKADDHIAHYYPWEAFDKYPFNSVGLGLNEALLQRLREHAPQAQVVMNFGCRIGTGIIFGSLLASTGLAETIGTAASRNLPVTNVLAITAFSTVLAILISETTSNTASAAVVVPIVIPLCTAIGVDPFVPALAATFAASFGFMLPVSTPQNAIVYGSGTVPIIRMIRTGLVFDIVGALLIIGIVPVMVAVTGIGG